LGATARRSSINSSRTGDDTARSLLDEIQELADDDVGGRTARSYQSDDRSEAAEGSELADQDAHGDGAKKLDSVAAWITSGKLTPVSTPEKRPPPDASNDRSIVHSVSEAMRQPEQRVDPMHHRATELLHSRQSKEVKPSAKAKGRRSRRRPRDAQKEYFYMTMMAVNMKRIEAGRPFVTSDVNEKLYVRAQQGNVLMQDWHQWAQEQLDNAEVELFSMPASQQLSDVEQSERLAKIIMRQSITRFTGVLERKGDGTLALWTPYLFELHRGRLAWYSVEDASGETRQIKGFLRVRDIRRIVDMTQDDGFEPDFFTGFIHIFIHQATVQDKAMHHIEVEHRLRGDLKICRMFAVALKGAIAELMWAEPSMGRISAHRQFDSPSERLVATPTKETATPTTPNAPDTPCTPNTTQLKIDNIVADADLEELDRLQVQDGGCRQS